MDIGPAELLIVLLIVVILFGGGRVAKVGGELGSAVANFRKGLQNPDGWKESDSLHQLPLKRLRTRQRHNPHPCIVTLHNAAGAIQ